MGRDYRHGADTRIKLTEWLLKQKNTETDWSKTEKALYVYFMSYRYNEKISRDMKYYEVDILS